MSEDLKTMLDGSRLNGPLCPGYTRCPALRALVDAAERICDRCSESNGGAGWIQDVANLRAALAALKEQ